jgi:hypothetical protein
VLLVLVVVVVEDDGGVKVVEDDGGVVDVEVEDEGEVDVELTVVSSFGFFFFGTWRSGRPAAAETFAVTFAPATSICSAGAGPLAALAFGSSLPPALETPNATAKATTAAAMTMKIWRDCMGVTFLGPAGAVNRLVV